MAGPGTVDSNKLEYGLEIFMLVFPPSQAMRLEDGHIPNLGLLLQMDE